MPAKRRASVAVYPTLLLLLTCQAASTQLVSPPAGEAPVHFELRTQIAPPDFPLVEFTATLDDIYRYVGNRLGVSDEEFRAAISTRSQQNIDGLSAEMQQVLAARRVARILLTIGGRDAGSCPPRGMAMAVAGSRPEIRVFVDSSTTFEEAQGIFAHELGHLYHWIAVAQATGAALFDQGFASWAGGRYWTDMLDASSFNDLVLRYLESGDYVPLPRTEEQLALAFDTSDDVPAHDCLARRDRLFTVWAAFIDYLVDEFGRDRLYELMRSPPLTGADGIAVSLDYETVYGRTLEELESAWLTAVRGPD